MNKARKDDDFMHYVEQRLEHWARWYSSGNYYGLGFHSETIEYVLMTVGVMIKSTGLKPLPYDEGAEEIEALVTEMTKHNEKMAIMLRIHYFGNGLVSERAEKLGVSYGRFRVYVDMARQWLAGRLSARYRSI